MSDHGEMLGDHGIYFKGPHFYDCQVRIPLIMRWRRRDCVQPSGEGLIELVDLAPFSGCGQFRDTGTDGAEYFAMLRVQRRLRAVASKYFLSITMRGLIRMHTVRC